MKKIGIFDSGVETPEEIILAAGLIPYRLFGDPSIEPYKANEHIPPTHCIWTRNLLEQAARFYAKTRKVMIVCSIGLTQHTTGMDKVKSPANLAASFC